MESLAAGVRVTYEEEVVDGLDSELDGSHAHDTNTLRCDLRPELR